MTQAMRQARCADSFSLLAHLPRALEVPIDHIPTRAGRAAFRSVEAPQPSLKIWLKLRIQLSCASQAILDGSASSQGARVHLPGKISLRIP
jgi:hypothetical protein